MKKIQLWSEGYSATGGEAKAIFHGEFEAVDLRDAVRQFKDTLIDERDKKCVHVDSLDFWGCRFFDNEADARKSFG
jgi:hypothetical protein